MHGRFAGQARLAPAAIAVEDCAGRLTYAELDGRAARVAERLRALGVGPEGRVGVAMERSAALVAALLGTLRAGAAYVPLDAAYPAERLAWMVEDAAVSVLLVDDEVPAALASYRGPVVSIARLLADGAGEVDEESATARGDEHRPGGEAESLAYVVYTSGSTGTPKGIGIPHGAVVRRVCDTDYVRLGPGDRVAQVASASFDAAVFEIWGPLLNGGTVVVLPREVTLDPQRLGQALAGERITTLFLTTALFHQVAREAPEALRPLRQVLFGGEASDPAAVRRVVTAGGPARVLHVYGPTETTVFATWHPVAAVPEEARTVPIGGPVAGIATHVLDGALRPVARGEAGELYLGGVGLARGYLGRPALTAERFVPDPFSAQPGARLYRTGDVVRQDGDGALEFVGRSDGQVKIRGFRIETGEVEAALLRHPAVREAVVAAREDALGERRLVAWVASGEDDGAGDASGAVEKDHVATGGVETDGVATDGVATDGVAGDALRAWLAERLPDYMLPAAVVVLPRLPLNANGKTDRAALPDPTPVVSAGDDARTMPRTATEVALAEIWREVLGVPGLGVEDDFYALGGHSLRAAQVSARVRERLGVELSPVRVLDDARTIARLAAVVDASGGRSDREGTMPIPRAPRDGPLPLSSAQEAVWFFQQVSPGLRSYHFAATLELHGALDVPALERALGEIVRRHEILRTTFPAGDGGRPVQVIHGPWPVRLPVADLRELADGERDGAVRTLLAGDFEQPFDLAALPLVRWRLLRLADDRHLLAQVEHHFVHDGWSFTVLVRELLALYAAFARGEPSPLAEPEVQFADYAAWQRAWLRGPEAAAQLAFWRRALAGAPPVLELPTDRPRPPEIRFSGGSFRAALPRELVAAARAFGRERGATLYVVLLAAFQGLLSRLSGQDELVVGGSVANRGRRELEATVGMIVNTVALRADLSDDPTFAELAERTRHTVREAQAHGEIPFDRVVDAVQPARTLSHLPVYQVLFSAHGSPMPPLELPGLSVRVTEGHGNGSAKFDLSVVLIPRGDQSAGADPDVVEAIWEFNADLFDEATVRRLAASFTALAADALADPRRRLSTLALGAGDASLLRGERAGESPRCIHHLFEEQARRTPGTIALVHEGRSVTYAALDAAADRLARRLRGLGVGPETVVGVMLPRAPELVAALLGVLKAGGAYLPLDAAHPTERLALMLEECAASVVIAGAAPPPTSGEGTAPQLPPNVVVVAMPVIGADADEAGIAASADVTASAGDGAPSPDVSADVSPDHLAYVLYTSGSTGRPKGVMVAHAGAAERIRWLRDTTPAADLRRALASTSVSFDVSVVELFGPLCAGGMLVLVENALELAHQPQAGDVRLASMVPSAAAELLRTGGIPRTLRTLNLAGEALPPDLARRLYAETGVERVNNVYGPTEDSVYSTWTRVPAGAERVAIGRPLPGSRACLLDAALRPLPEGVPGELYLAGVGVARGYLRQPGLTAARFLPDPFAEEPGARMYRTGDRARVVRGEVEYLGRLDGQVKVRGFRIEPGEVEAALRACDGVGEATVVARDDGGRRRLVAYVVPSGRGDASPTTLRARLRERLPEYMVPGAFVTLAELPRTHSGKLDRRALPAPDVEETGDAAAVAPRTPAEAALVEVWRALLGVERVGVHDNFFDLGGDSILALQVVSRAARAGLRLTPRQLFRHQTVAELAAAAGTDLPSPAADADAEPEAGDFPLTPVQRWFFAGQPRGPSHWNQAVWLEAAEPLDAAVLEQALHRVVEHHAALRLRFARGGGGWSQEYAPVEEARLLRVVDLSSAHAEGRVRETARIAAEVQGSLDIAHGPLLRAALFAAGASAPQRLLVAVHHLAIDGVSWRILREDLETALRALAAGLPVAFPPRTTPFRGWAERLRELATSPELRSELPYWAELAGAPAGLPVDLPGENTEGSVATVRFALDREETAALLRDAPTAFGARADETLLAALGRVLAAWTRRDEVLVEVEGHGREPLFADVDLSRTVGWFTSLFPLRLDVGPARDPGEAVAAVRAAMRRLPRRGVGFGVLRHLCPDPEVARRLDAIPPAGVVFNYLGRFGDDGEARLLRLAGGDVGPLRAPQLPRRHLLEVTARVLDGELHVAWRYSTAVHRPSTVADLAHGHRVALRELAAAARAGARHDLVPVAPGRDASDAGPDDGGDEYPLTPVQEGMLFHTREAPGSGAYVVQAIWTLHGDVDEVLLRRAWEETADRHAALRTVFAWEGRDHPVQRVRRRAAIPLERIDWGALAPAEGERRLAAWLEADRRRGFALADAPPLRLALARTGVGEHRLVVTFHHLVLDGWSHALVLREVLARYAALRRGAHAELPAAPPFRDYVARVTRGDGGQAERFWRAELAGAEAPTPLPLDRGQAVAPSPGGDSDESDADRGDGGHGEAAVRLDAATTAALAEFVRRGRLTLGTLVHGAWALALARWTGAGEVVFGSVGAGRPPDLPGAEAMVGLLATTIPLRAAVPLRDEPVGWLRGLQERHAEARRHEHAPLVRLREWSGVPAGAPLFETLLAFENYPLHADGSGEDDAGLRLAGLQAREQTSYPLTVIVRPGRELSLRVLFSRARLRDGDAARVAEHFRLLLEGFARGGAATLGALASAAEAGLGPIPREWTEHPRPYPRDAAVHRLFEETARATPAAVAVETTEGATLTYAELNARANRLARLLRARGVRPGSHVGVALERSAELVVALLAVLKAGAAYVPLDAGYPAARLAFMADDAELAALVVRDGVPTALRGWTGPVVSFATDRIAIAAASPDDLGGVPVDAEWPAYVLYTSGSTGRPKGVTVPHRAVVRLVRGADYAGFGPEQVFLQLAPVAFDASTFELWGALLNGARLVLAPARTPSLEELGRLVRERGVTTLWLTAGLFHQLADARLDDLRGVRQLLAGGDVLSPEQMRRVAAALPGTRLVNGYGPTENTTFTCCHTVRAADVPQASVPIGRPVANTQVHVLDAELRPVPAGAVGELCTGGDGLATGYLGRPALTAERFVPDPLSGRPGARLLRTGDRARWRDDGTLEFLGRLDGQVKIRGFRIETGEIEAALRTLPGVGEAAVVAREDALGERRLVAYVVLSRGESDAAPSRPDATATELRAQLAARLPEHMLPSALVRLPALPLTVNGKVDRRALPAPEAPDAGRTYLAPETGTERRLADLWAEVLGAERVGLADDFFALGGHSLRAMRLVSRVREVLGVELPLRAPFEAPTLAALAARIDAEAERVLGRLVAELETISEAEARTLLEAESRGT